MTGVLVNVGIVLLLVLIEGLFVAAELALVSLRESQVLGMEARGRRGRRVAKLVRDPNRFLGTVQLGVTTTAIVSGAFGAGQLTDSLEGVLNRVGLHGDSAYALAFLVVALLIAFVTIVIGELVPKRLALQRAEGTAQAFAAPLDRLAITARPVIWLLSSSTNVLVRLLGGDPGAGRDEISGEELRGLITSHEGLSTEERRIVDEVFAAQQRTVREVMVPRTEVTFLEASTTVAQAMRAAGDLPHSRYPVVGESQDDVTGFVHVRDLVAATRPPVRRGLKVGEVAREIKRLPETKNVLAALSEMRREGQHVAVVVDEYGGTAGIVTLEDLIEEVIGDIRDEYDEGERASDARRLHGGDVEVDGLLNLDEFEEATFVHLPEGPYETAAGFVTARLGHLPTAGEAIEVVPAESEGVSARLTVARLEGRRVARLRVTLLTGPDGDVPPDGQPEDDGAGAARTPAPADARA